MGQSSSSFPEARAALTGRPCPCRPDRPSPARHVVIVLSTVSRFCPRLTNFNSGILSICFQFCILATDHRKYTFTRPSACLSAFLSVRIKNTFTICIFSTSEYFNKFLFPGASKMGTESWSALHFRAIIQRTSINVKHILSKKVSTKNYL